MLGDLENELRALRSGTGLELDFEGVEDRWEVVRVKVDIDDGTNDGLDSTDLVRGGGSVRSSRGDYG